MNTNELGQPVGDPVQDWVARDRPSADVLVGRYCTLQRLDPERHAEDLFSADRHDQHRESWTYLPYGRSPSQRGVPLAGEAPGVNCDQQPRPPRPDPSSTSAATASPSASVACA